MKVLGLLFRLISTAGLLQACQIAVAPCAMQQSSKEVLSLEIKLLEEENNESLESVSSHLATSEEALVDGKDECASWSKVQQKESNDQLVLVGQRDTGHRGSDEQDITGDTPLHSAVREGKLALIASLVKRGADVNECNGEGDTPLHIAAHAGQDDAVELLLKHGADVWKENEDGNNALYLAIMGVSSSVVKVLLAHEPKLSRGQAQFTPLELTLAMQQHRHDKAPVPDMECLKIARMLCKASGCCTSNDEG